MRLINADALKSEFTGNFQEEYGISQIKAMIDIQPTIKSEPIKHGKLEEVSIIRKIVKCNIPISKCSLCGFSFCDVLNSNELYQYCPNCGAKMDGDENA